MNLTQMTQRYAHLATADLHAAIREMEPNLVTGAEDSIDARQVGSQ